MKKLWVFGCSISDLYDSETSKYFWSSEYLKWKGYTPKHYTEILAKEFNCELKNYAISGTNNYEILQSICDKINHISNDDFIILQWTETTRFRLVDDSDNWVNFVFKNSQNKIQLKNNKHLSIQTIQEILMNRLSTKYADEIRSWEILIKNKLNSDNLIILYPFTNLGNYGNIVKSIENIAIETNGEIDDPHFSEAGQRQLAKIILDTKKNII